MNASQKWRVLIGSKSFGQAYPEHLKLLEDAGCYLIPNGVGGRAYSEGELIEALIDVDAIITGTDELTVRVINAAKRLKVIAKHGVGLETIDLEAARVRGIVVSATPVAIHNSVADLTMALLLAVARNIVPVHIATYHGGWTSPFGLELQDKVMGIVGLGRIGKAVARRASGFGMRIIAYDPIPDEVFGLASGVTFVPLDDLLRTADVISLHVAAEQTDGTLIDAEHIRMMKPSTIFLNTARGSLVDERALATALREKRLWGAGLDAFAKEPPTKSPLLELDNVVLTPHMGGRTYEGLRRMGEITVENCLRSLRNETPLYPV